MCSWNWQNWLHKCILKGRHWRREREKKWKLKRAFIKILKWPIFNAGNRVVWKCENPITWTAVLLFCFLIHEALIITTKQNKKVKCRNKSLQNQSRNFSSWVQFRRKAYFWQKIKRKQYLTRGRCWCAEGRQWREIWNISFMKSPERLLFHRQMYKQDLHHRHLLSHHHHDDHHHHLMTELGGAKKKQNQLLMSFLLPPLFLY